MGMMVFGLFFKLKVDNNYEILLHFIDYYSSGEYSLFIQFMTKDMHFCYKKKIVEVGSIGKG